MPSFVQADMGTIIRHLQEVLTRDSTEMLTQVPAGMRAAAVLAPLYIRDGRPHVLFTRRSTRLNAHRGEIAFPGGSHEPTDDSLERTALREAQEEIGLDPERVALLGMLDPVVTVVSNFIIIPFVGYLPHGTGPLQPNPQEVAAILEIPLAALDDPAIFHSEEWVRGGEPHTVYFFDYGPNRIWGATARVLVDLLERLQAGAEPHGSM